MTLMERAFAPPVGGPMQCSDFFAGECAISKAYVRKGYNAVAMDVCLDPKDDPQLQKRHDGISYLRCFLLFSCLTYRCIASIPICIDYLRIYVSLWGFFGSFGAFSTWKREHSW